MAKKNHRRSRKAKAVPVPAEVPLLGSSVDTMHSDLHYGSTPDQRYSHKNSNKNSNNKHSLGGTNHIKVSRGNSYLYATINDDIIEEAALLSSSGGGYDAEIEDDRFNSNSNSSYASQTGDEGDDINSDDELNDNNINFFSNINTSNNITNNDGGSRILSTGNLNKLGVGPLTLNDNGSIFSEESDSALLLEERDTYKFLAWHKRPSVLLLSSVLFLFAFSVGVAMSSELTMILTGVCYVTNGNLDNCSSNEVQQNNAQLQKWINFASSIIKIIVSTKVGKLSDIHGRKIMILFTFFMTALSRLLSVFVLTPKYFTYPGVFACSILDAMGGSMFVLLGVANSYTIDVVHEKERLKSLGTITGALFLGLSLGPFVSSIVSITFKVRSIYLMMASFVLIFLSFFFVLFILPESRSVKLRNKSRRFSVRSQRELESNQSWTYKLGLHHYIDSFSSLKLLWVTRPLDFNPTETGSSKAVSMNMPNSSNSQSNNVSSTPKPLAKKRFSLSRTNDNLKSLLESENEPTDQIDMSARINGCLLLAIEILVNFCSVGSTLPVALYLIYQFNMSQSQLGLFVGFAAGFRSFALTVFNPWLQHFLLELFNYDPINVDFIDVTTIMISIVCELVAAFFVSFSTSFFGVIVYVVLASISSIGSPVIHSTLLKYNTNPGKNGEFFGALALIRNVLNLIAPLIFLSIYSYGVSISKPYIIFYIIILLFFTAAVLLGNLKFYNHFQ